MQPRAGPMTWARRVGLAFLLLLLALIALLWFAVATQSGTARVLDLAQSQTGGELSWQKASGSLVGPLKFEQLSLQPASGQRVEIGSAELEWQPRSLLEKKIQLDSLKLDGVEIHLPDADPDAAPPAAKTKLQLIDFELPFAADVRQLLVTNLTLYPAGAAEPVKIDRIALSADGEADRIRLADLQIEMPQGRASMQGEMLSSGDWPTDLTIDWQFDDAKLGRLQGEGRVSGGVKSELAVEHSIDGLLQSQQRFTIDNLLKGPRWRGEVQLKIDDGAPLAPALAGFATDLNFATHGQLMPDGGGINATVSSINGAVNQYELLSRGELKLLNNQLELSGFAIEAGQSSLQLNGSVADNLDVQWSLDIPKLDELLPAASGRVNGSGELVGLLREAQLRADLDITALKVDALEIGSLLGEARVDLTDQNESTLALQAKTLSVAGSNWQMVDLRAQGMLARNSMAISIDGDAGKIDTQLVGGWDGTAWLASFQKLAVSDTILGDWSLLEPASVVASAEQVRAHSLCLLSDPAQICMNANWARADGAVLSSTINRFPVDRFARWLPTELQSEQFFNAYLVATQSTDAERDVKLNLQLPAGPLTYEADGKTIRREMGLSTLVANLASDQLDVDAKIGLGVLGDANVQAVVADILDKRTLDASIAGEMRDLSLVSTFVPRLQTVRGVLDIDMQLAGSIEQPVPSGQLQLREFGVELPEVAVQITDGELTLEPTENGLFDISGRATSGEGRLRISGVADLPARELNLKLNGDRFQVANSRSLRAVVSPNLEVKLNEQGAAVRGELVIPTAFYKSGGSSGAVKESGDVVIVDNGREIEPVRKASGIDLDVTVRLGDEVEVEAGDFDGSITGVLSLEQSPGTVVTGSGTIEVVNGDYLIYGQKLTMERGRVLFGGGPLTNPELDLDVVRDVPAYEVRAGARVRGTAAQPLLELYSDPVYTDANILSFIVLGQPLGTKGGSYTLGKFITPDLYVSYGLSLFGGDDTYNMRYKLNDRLTLQAVRSGENNSADLEYTLER